MDKVYLLVENDVENGTLDIRAFSKKTIAQQELAFVLAEKIRNKIGDEEIQTENDADGKTVRFAVGFPDGELFFEGYVKESVVY